MLYKLYFILFSLQESSEYQHMDATSEAEGHPTAWDAAPRDHTPRPTPHQPPRVEEEEGEESEGECEEMDTSQPNTQVSG